MTAKAPTARRVVRSKPDEDDEDDDLDFRDDLAEEQAARPAPVPLPASLAPLPTPALPATLKAPPKEAPVSAVELLDDDDDDLDDDDLDGADVDEEDDPDDDDDDDDDDEPAPVARRPMPQLPRVRAPRRPRVPRPDSAPPEMVNRAGVSRQGVNQIVEGDTNDFFSTMSELEFGTNKFKISLTRVTPEFVDGVKAAGYLDSFTRAITPEEIKQRYGGGTYRVMVFGPNARTGKNCCLGQRMVEIAGEAEAPGNAMSSSRRKKDTPEPVGLDLTKIILQEKERDVQRAREDAKAMQKQLSEAMQKSEGGIEKVLTAMMSMNNPGQLREEFREERRMQELKMQQEREDRRRDQEALARQHERSLQESRMQHEKSIEMMRMEQARLASEAQIATQRNENFYKEQMALLDRQNAEKERRGEEHTKMMMTMMENSRAQQFAQMQQVESLKTQFLTETIKEMRKTDDKSGIKQLLETKQLIDALSGNGGGDGKEGWEKILDKAGEVAPGLMAAANMYLNRGGQTQAPGQPAPPRIQAGSVAVVDLPAQPALQAAPASPPKRRKPAPTLLRRRPVAPPAVVVEAQVEPVAVVEPVPAPELVPDLPNDMPDFVIPDTTMEAEPAIKLLVQNIDLALQRGYDAQKTYDEIVLKYPRGVVELLKMTSPELIIETLSKLAPATWLINTPAGTALIEELFPMIKEM